MDKNETLAALSALAHTSRLDIVRLLVRTGPEGMAAGDIAAHLGVLQNTLSTHLGLLHRAGLVHSRREGRVIRYFADMTGFAGLLGYLMEDCCGGKPELCQPVLSTLVCAC